MQMKNFQSRAMSNSYAAQLAEVSIHLFQTLQKHETLKKDYDDLQLKIAEKDAELLILRSAQLAPSIPSELNPISAPLFFFETKASRKVLVKCDLVEDWKQSKTNAFEKVRKQCNMALRANPASKLRDVLDRVTLPDPASGLYHRCMGDFFDSVKELDSLNLWLSIWPASRRVWYTSLSNAKHKDKKGTLLPLRCSISLSYIGTLAETDGVEASINGTLTFFVSLLIF